MKNKKIIGILGGMGPSASGYLYSVINTLAISKYGARKNSDFPETVLYSVPVPDFISSSRNKEKALQMLAERVKKMNALNINVMGIACNTAHMLLPELQTVSNAKFISMIDESGKSIALMKIKKVGILATSSTIRSGLYQEALKKKGVDLLIPDKAEQKKIDTIIRDILAEKGDKKRQRVLTAIADNLQRKGAQGIVLACTELPLLFPKKYKLPQINSVEVLARALLRETMI